MKARVFHPQKHGFPFTNNWNLSAQQMETLKCLALEKIPNVLRRLNQEQPGTASLFCVKEWLEKWIEEAWAGAYGMQCGMMHTALDFFYYKKRLPKGSVLSPTIKACIWQRNQDAFMATMERLLFQIAVTRIINVSTIWYDKQLIEKTIKKQLKVIKEVAVEEVEVDMKWPAEVQIKPINSNRREWEKIKKHLDDQGPWPITLMDDNLDPFRQKTLIATCYQELKEQQIQVAVYDLDQPGKTLTLQVDLEKNSFELAGKSYEGWFCEKYIAKRPSIKATIFSRLCKRLKAIWRFVQILLKKLK